MKLLKFNLNEQEFQDKYFEKQYFLKRNAIKDIGYRWKDVTREFFTVDPSDHRLKIFNSSECNKQEYVDLIQDANSIKSVYKNRTLEEMIEHGASIVLNHFERNSLFVSKLCRELQEYTTQRCVGNAYIAKGGNGTFGKHWDTHCVFALQLLGKKLWRLYKPTHTLPLRFETSKHHKQDCPLIPELETVLSKGDALYIPRGWWHEAIPIEKCETLHIAAGIHTIKYSEYIKNIIDEKLTKIESSRETINNNNQLEDLIRIIEKIKLDIINSNNISEFIRKSRSTSAHNEFIDFEKIMLGKIENENSRA